MQIKTALILCAGLGKRLNPLTLEKPKPLLELNRITMLENSIHMIENLGIKNILINTFYLKEQIENFLNQRKFKCNIKIIHDGINILNTGGGILNMINNTNEHHFLILNPDTYWQKSNLIDIKKMEKIYFENSYENVLLLVKKKQSFDKSLKGDFQLHNNQITIGNKNNFIYTGCQILNRKLFLNFTVRNFPISKIWLQLIKKNKLFGSESFNKFYHLTDLKTFRKLKDL